MVLLSPIVIKESKNKKNAYVLKITNYLYSEYQRGISRNSGGYDVVDFRVGTLIAIVFFGAVPFINATFEEKIPDIPIARTILLLSVIGTFIGSYCVPFIQKWANHIGNLSSITYAIIILTAVYRANFPIQDIAIASIGLFALMGMFKLKNMLILYVTIILCILFVYLAIGESHDLSKGFIATVSLFFFGVGYYAFYRQIETLEKLVIHEKELEKSEIWFRSVFDNAPIGIAILNENFRADRINSHFCKMTGYSEIELNHIGLHNLFEPEDLVPTDKLKDILDGKMESPEQRLYTHTGETLWLRLRMSPMMVDGQSFVIAMFTDITMEKQAQEQLKKSAHALKLHNDALEEFSYVISHDLQEPLRMITSFTQIIQRRYVSQLTDEEAHKDFNFVIDGTKRMSTLIRDMLEYSRWSALILPLESVNMNDILAIAMENLRLMISQSQAKIRIDEDVSHVIANRHMLVQVFQNLLSNAIKYRHPEWLPVIDVHVEKRENQWLFTVKDNGKGFEPQYRERIFGIFQRLDTDRTLGNGIGLAICKRIIERQGGRIWADSIVGEGSIFRFTLPFVDLKTLNTDSDDQQEFFDSPHLINVNLLEC